MSAEAEQSVLLKLPNELWAQIYTWMDFPTLSSFMASGAVRSDQQHRNKVLATKFSSYAHEMTERLKVHFPRLETDTRVSVERLIKQPGFLPNITLEYLTQSVQNTLKIWNCAESDQYRAQDIKDIILPLLDAGNVDIHGHRNKYSSPLLQAIVERYAPNERGNSPGAESGARVIKALLDAGAAIDAVDEFGHTALHTAAEFGSNLYVKRGYEGSAEPIIQILLSQGADVNAFSTQRCFSLPVSTTPLHIACTKTGIYTAMCHGRYNIENLLCYSADPFAQNASGVTPWSILQQEGKEYDFSRMCEILMMLEEATKPQKVWESYEDTVAEYYISGGLADLDHAADA